MTTNSSRGHLAICLPAHNEREALSHLLPEIVAELALDDFASVTIFVFDDGSGDGTAAYISDLSLPGVGITLLRSLVRVGKSQALNQLLGVALEGGAARLVVMDADGQDDPRFLSDMIDGLEAGGEIVNGRRTNRAHSVVKRLSSKAFNGVARAVTGLSFWDINSGYKAYTREAAQIVQPYLYGEMHRVVLIVAQWLGLRVQDVPVVNRPRSHGKTKYGIARGWRGIFDLITIQFLRRYHSRPGHFFSGVGVVLSVVGIVLIAAGFASPSTGASVAVVPGIGALGALIVMLGTGSLVGGIVMEFMLFLSKNPSRSMLRLTVVAETVKTPPHREK